MYRDVEDRATGFGFIDPVSDRTMWQMGGQVC